MKCDVITIFFIYNLLTNDYRQMTDDQRLTTDDYWRIVILNVEHTDD